MIGELNDFVNRVRTIDARLIAYSDELLKKMGVTPEKLEKEINRLKEEHLKSYEGKFEKA